ncbi:MAG: hypothetical protein H0W33_05010 [Gammaproteobacteria bacterium]|nr:hypothetical protein [Gammaproteobacteria bacterium]
MSDDKRVTQLATRFDTETARERIERLAELDAVTYEMQRKDAAEKLGMRAAALDKLVKRQAPAKLAGRAIEFADPEPCAEPVSTSALLNELAACLRRYIVLPAHAQVAVALWTLHTWALDAVQLSPLLAVQSPQKRCGKSHLLMLLGEMVYRPLVATNVTPAALFRTVEAHAPTLLLDEADTWLRDNDDLRGLVNAGHTRKTAFTLRVVGDDFDCLMLDCGGLRSPNTLGLRAPVD